MSWALSEIQHWDIAAYAEHVAEYPRNITPLMELQSRLARLSNKYFLHMPQTGM